MNGGSEQRQVWIDALRGLAILLMIPANLAPYLSEPHPMWYRLAGSYVAPMFIALSAGMVALRAGRHSMAYYVKRAASVVAVGMLLDILLWRIAPWTSFDVLYIIGPGMLLAYPTRRWKPSALFAVAGLFFAAGSVAQGLLGYDPTPFEIYFSDPGFPGVSRLAASWFIDGWFPMLPWTGFVLFGTALFGMLLRSPELPGSLHPDAPGAPQRTRRLAAAGAALLLAGVIGLITPIPGIMNFADGSVLASREGYSEIFYPPSIAYAASAAGVVILAALAFRRVHHVMPHSALAFFGRYSMLVYVLHQVLGVHLVKAVLSAYGLETMDSGWLFLASICAVTGLVAVLCALTGYIKKRFPPRWIFLQVLVGR